MYESFIIKDFTAYLEIVKLARENGKNPGDSMREEFQIIMKQRPEAFEFIGVSDNDIDMMTGDLREQGIKVLNMNELNRQSKNV